jgi:hypothetical protein
MTLTLADIERWDAGAIRDVSNALAKRGASVDEVHDGLAKLPLIGSWHGSGGDAARASLDELSRYLAAHGLDMARLSSATRDCADDVERIKAGLLRIEDDATREGFSIDTATGAVTPVKEVGDPMYFLQQLEVEQRIKELLQAANTADAALAQAITTADDDATGRPTDPRVADALTRPLPDDPKRFHDLWQQLSQEQKDALYRKDHSIGNHDGMPAVDRDYYNRQALTDELTVAQGAQARADALRGAHSDWADGHPPPTPHRGMSPEGLQRYRDYKAWQQQYTAATDGARHLPDLQAIDKAAALENRYVLLVDTTSGDLVHAAIAVGNPDTAEHISVTTPGLNTTVHDSLISMTSEAIDLQRETLRQLSGVPGHELDGVSTIAWIGYDAPQIPGLDEKAESLAGAWGVSHDDLAKAGAHDLAGFYDGITASHDGVPAELTAIGHSYGSLTTGLALQEPGSHGVTNAIFYGSPGIEATTPQQLQLQNGHVFTMETPNDPIQAVYDGPLALKTGAAFLPPPFNQLVLGGTSVLDMTGAGQFGPNPATNPNFVRLETGAASVPDGSGGTLHLGAAQGHGEYPRFMDDGTPRTTNYNIAAVIAGLDGNAIRQK